METVFAKLLNDFENGTLTRRQLLQSLTLVAMTASPAANAARSPQSAVPWKTVWLDHISFQVSDYKRSVDFYTSLMGWKVRDGSDNGRQATLDIGDVGGIIIRNGRRPAALTQPVPTAPDSGAGRGGDPARPPITGVIDHISWGIEPWDTDTVKGELDRRELNPRVDTGSGGDIATSPFKSFHVKDPDGWDLQISNQTKGNHQ
jgi:catechol 2,3-dioxygenase-like lactoylglutathione lyase family enzyme